MDDSADYTLAGHGMSAKQDMFEQMIRSFEAAGMPYCILAGYDELPHHIASDIDFMLDPSWSTRLPGLIASIGAASGAQLVQHLQHETTAAYFVLARLHGDTVTYLHPDSSSDYRRDGKLWLRAQSVLENRRRHRHGFWIPSAADAFSYYLIKKLNKGSLDRRQTAELAARYREDKENCEQRLHELLPAAEAAILKAALNSGADLEAAPWQAVYQRMPQLKHALQRQESSLSWHDKAREVMQNLHRIYIRCRQPTGLRMVFLGPDGSGKSSIINAVSQQLAPAFRRVEYRHLQPRRHPATNTRVVTDPHALPRRGLLGSLAKLLHFWSGYHIGNLFWLYPSYVRSTLVIFDRYYHDLLADPARYRYSGPLPLARTMGGLLPQPDLVFILDAPAAVLQARKQEVTPTESARQRSAYLTLTQEFRYASIIDTTQPLEQAVSQVLAQALAFLEQRTALRLGLTNSTQALDLCKP